MTAEQRGREPARDEAVRVGGEPGVDLLAIGETMAQLAPGPGARLAPGAQLTLTPGGAESNVAMQVSRLGHSAAWLSRLGADALGRVVAEGIAAAGVEVVVEYDPDRPTGVYVKDPGPDGTGVLYYRAGSAASAMGPALLTAVSALRPRFVHVSGITAALSESCLALVCAVLDGAVPGARVSFDVNHRPALWTAPPGALLRELAARADVVFVGRDEAERLWGTATAEDVRALLPDVGSLVVKDGAAEAVAFTGSAVERVPTPPVDVVEPVGAGDAFAAGWLGAALDGRDARARLLAGHRAAAAVLQSHTDLPAAGEAP